jgi:hypothetical protein
MTAVGGKGGRRWQGSRRRVGHLSDNADVECDRGGELVARGERESHPASIRKRRRIASHFLDASACSPKVTKNMRLHASANVHPESFPRDVESIGPRWEMKEVIDDYSKCMSSEIPYGVVRMEVSEAKPGSFISQNLSLISYA